jgi:asparagine synthase (glutamine-hydrolysing)
VEVEGEHPFLDDLDLVELVLRLPPESAFDPRFDRPLLREAVAGLVPDDVRLRRGKSYFDALFQESLSGVDHDAIARLLGPGAETAALVDPARVREQLVEAPTERRGGRWAWTLWRLTMLECWLRSQSDPGFAERVLETWGLAEARVAPLGLRPA